MTMTKVHVLKPPPTLRPTRPNLTNPKRKRMTRTRYEESVVDKFKSNLLLMIFWLNIINYNS